MTASKRIFDLVLATLGILLIWPLLLLVALAVKCNDRGPVFFRQERVGEGGKRFRIWKFRTMRSASQGNGNPLTVGQDPRVTAVGYWLRRSKLDELPQLLNVIRGEMSFVGPRPELPYFVDRYTAEQRRVLQLRPGVTSLASIKFRNEDDILGHVEDPERFFMEKIVPERARTDLEYAARATMLSDLVVMAKTVFSLGRRDAQPQDDAACCRQSTAQRR
jgi:lipopolysaccharide/colanic/teichoic acid biosynthesis glycosyltransferase